MALGLVGLASRVSKVTLSDSTNNDSFFHKSDSDWFQPTDHTRGPWHKDYCHAGPPTGLMARAAEQLIPDQQLVRLTINLARPIPFAGFSVHASVIKKGRKVSLASSILKDAEDRVCAQCETLHIAKQRMSDGKQYPSATSNVPSPDDAVTGDFPISRTLHDQPCFAGPGVETRYAAGHTPEPGPTIAWIRTVPLLPDEIPSPFQRMCPMADCGNAFSRNAEPWEVNFMNPDLTIAMFRPPEGEWMGSHAIGHWESTGIGLADATLLDSKGVVGRAIQTLLLQAAD